MNVSQQAKDSYMSFIVGGRYYAVCVVNVLEVVETSDISPLPGAPDYVEGIMNFRNEVLPVINTRKRLKITDLDNNNKPNKYSVVFETETSSGLKHFCALVDKVINVEEYTKNDIKIVDDLQNTAAAAPYIKGVITNKEKGFVYVILAEKIISPNDLETIKNIMGSENNQSEIATENNSENGGGFEFF